MGRDEPRRLPIFPDAGRAPDVAAEPAPDAERIEPPFPLLSVVAALPEAERAARAQAAAFVRAAAALGVRPTVLEVARAEVGSVERAVGPGDPLLEAGASTVRALAVEAPLARAEVSRALDALAGSELVISLGADVLAFASPRFALFVDRGAPVLGYSAMARSVRDRAHARVDGAREGWAKRIVAAVLSNSAARP